MGSLHSQVVLLPAGTSASLLPTASFRAGEVLWLSTKASLLQCVEAAHQNAEVDVQIKEQSLTCCVSAASRAVCSAASCC